MAYKASLNPQEDIRESSYVPELIKGMVVTARVFLRNLFGDRDATTVGIGRKGLSRVSTIAYPEEKIPYPEGYRGLHRLVPREDGSPRCVACYMCATACPAQCIYIEAGEYPVNDESAESRVIEKYPTAFVIDELRCVVCGLCVEACPKDAIRMDTGVHVPPEYNRQSFIYDAGKLLKGAEVMHPSDPWYRREGSGEPSHVHKEAHTRIGEASGHKLLAAVSTGNHSRVEVDTAKPVPVTRFLK
ncbi:MAG: NuoI/complex I 23 kDa subunit family protein [Myxococcaceae bacterium]